MSTSNSLLFVGLDGSNPLAFLAALGTLRVLTMALPDEDPRMGWEEAAGGWRPRLLFRNEVDPAYLTKLLDIKMRAASSREAFQIGDNINLKASDFRKHVEKAAMKAQNSTNADRDDAGFLAAFGCETCVGDDDIIQDTGLRTMSGAGHQHFLKFFRELIDKTDASHIQRALFHTWDYADEGRGLNLRWDPADDRRYAMRWDDPSSDPVKSMRGANRLAIEGMPLLPTMPGKSSLATTCFEGSGARNTFFLWPIWRPAIPVDVVRSLLQQIFHVRELSESDRKAIGVAAVFTSQRITTGKFRNFTPARAI